MDVKDFIIDEYENIRVKYYFLRLQRKINYFLN
jgi:hypothetical protein